MAYKSLGIVLLKFSCGKQASARGGAFWGPSLSGDGAKMSASGLWNLAPK